MQKRSKTVILFSLLIVSLYFLTLGKVEQLSFSKQQGQDNFSYAIISQFIHLNVWHLLVNLSSLLYLSRKKWKEKWYAILFLTTIIVTAFGLKIFANSQFFYLGSSGISFALLGFKICQRHKTKEEKVDCFSDVIFMVGMTLIVPNISCLVHFTGLFTGLMIGSLANLLNKKGTHNE
ncbi:Rhomboid family protein [Pilibacter termitis]|jgi:membrane associated rhomboid family serine protease|uniref:Rhomboid family protein n=1 Tax=Pilibacter termitis TaxID=263852 RepID=A0A1T4QW74_9ENTE|nr:rhomboid family intramembrane serine protease [Pilibacter termitis]SKA07807.1 Rhomboid family protein [Pilibacter termitis]